MFVLVHSLKRITDPKWAGAYDVSVRRGDSAPMQKYRLDANGQMHKFVGGEWYTIRGMNCDLTGLKTDRGRKMRLEVYFLRRWS